ncbi:RNA 2'-phosphotransferase family protein [Komagataeibacter rhaeticus]|uniref:hypothetical protein n=1 Tax=Komagataeibacter rhaeticus TaxID=215221 RepID=UPI0030843F21
MRPGRRQMVPLSTDRDTARHGKAVLPGVGAGRMFHDGYAFHKANNGLWLTLAVPRHIWPSSPGQETAPQPCCAPLPLKTVPRPFVR